MCFVAVDVGDGLGGVSEGEGGVLLRFSPSSHNGCCCSCGSIMLGVLGDVGDVVGVVVSCCFSHIYSSP